jgi:thiosulfate/3-mercaptopyruvate sulfurtransferase
VIYRFVDCRYELGKPGRGRELYLEGHIPGASFLDLDTDLSGAEGGGRHPLPSPEHFARSASRAGIGSNVFVVAYDQGMTGGAARLWWLLRHFGHEDVAVLADGLHGWLGALRSGEEEIKAAEFVPRERAGDTIGADELLARLGDDKLVVLDARAPERYRGEVEPIDPVAGHIPGALNAPYTDFPAVPHAAPEADDVIVYCGSGVTACVVVLALSRAGREAKLYPGSWSEWSNLGLPVERG